MTTPPDRKPPHRFDLSGGRLSLDFVNTAGGYRPERPDEHLHAYDDLLAFAEQAGAAGEPQARRLAAEARRRPRDAAAALRDAIELREGLYELFLAVARRRPPPAEELDRLNAALARALPHRRVVRQRGGFALAWDEPAGALDALLWPVVSDAAALLAEGDLQRVKVCGALEDAECSWLFLDRTKSGTRRWCSMQSCGNRAKARRHHERTKGEG
jgi:predicted RNA-binding Zn ribbon-like protein